MRNEQYACDAMDVNFMEADVSEGLYGLIKTKEIWDALHELYIDKKTHSNKDAIAAHCQAHKLLNLLH